MLSRNPGTRPRPRGQAQPGCRRTGALRRPAPAPSPVALCLSHVVGGEHDSRAARRQPADEFPQPLSLAGIERGGGLVEQQYGRLGQQPDADVDSLLVATGEPVDRVCRPLGQPGLLEHPSHRRLGI